MDGDIRLYYQCLGSRGVGNYDDAEDILAELRGRDVRLAEHVERIFSDMGAAR